MNACTLLGDRYKCVLLVQLQCLSKKTEQQLTVKQLFWTDINWENLKGQSAILNCYRAQRVQNKDASEPRLLAPPISVAPPPP